MSVGSDHGRSGGARESIRFWFDGALGASGVELLSGTFMQHRFEPHFHDECVIATFSGGAQRHRIGRHKGVARPGSVMIIPPGEAHAGEAEGASGWSYRAFYVDEATLAEAAGALDARREGREVGFAGVPLHEDAALARRLAEFHQVVERNTSEPLARQQAFAAAMSLIVRRFAGIGRGLVDARASQPIVRRIMELARERYWDPQLGIGQFAAATGLSPFHLMRAFRASTGLTSHAVVVQMRLRAARRLLVSGQPAAEVAAAVGFSDQSHLIRRFKQAFGMTPGTYVAASVL